MQGSNSVLIAHDELDTEDVLHEPVQVSQLFVQLDQPVQAKDGVHDLVPDLFLGLDPAHHLVDAPVANRLGVVFDDVGDQRGAAPSLAVEVAQAPHLTIPEIEVGLRIEVERRDVLHQREAFLRADDAADGETLERIAPAKERIAVQLAEAVQALFAVANHPGECRTDLAQVRPTERECVPGMRRCVHLTTHLIEVDDEIVDQWLVGHQPQR